MTPAEIIATVEARLRDGTGRAATANGCQYYTRREDGYVQRCAVGALFTEEQAYELRLAGIGGWSLDNRATLERILGPDHWALDESIEGLLVSLQELHDNSDYWEEGDWTCLNEVGEARLQEIKNGWIDE